MDSSTAVDPVEMLMTGLSWLPKHKNFQLRSQSQSEFADSNNLDYLMSYFDNGVVEDYTLYNMRDK